MEAAYHRLQAQGQPITSEMLSAAAHADNRADGVFVRLHSKESEQRAQIRFTPQQQRLEEAYARMVGRGECLSISGLKAAAHIGTAPAWQFLRSRGVPLQKGGPRKNQSHAVQ